MSPLTKQQLKLLDKIKENDFRNITSLPDDHEFMLVAVRENAHALNFALDHFKADREIVLAAVNQDGIALKYAPSEFKKDRTIVQAAVNKYGYALQYASSELKTDREIALEAVKQSGWALDYASFELQADREVVLEAVKKNGNVFQYASSELKADRDIVIIAMMSSRCIPSDCSEVLKNDLSLKLLGDFLSSSDLKCLVDFSKKSKDNYELVLKMLREVGELLKKEYDIDSYENISALHRTVRYIFQISRPYNISLVFDLDTPGYRDEEDWFTYGSESDVSTNAFYSYRSLMTCIEKLRKGESREEEYIQMLNATCVQSDISLLTRLFWGNKIFKKFMDEKELWEEIDHKYASLIKGLSSSDISVLVDWRIVHLFHVFGGIEGTEGANALIHTQSLINCLNETGNGEIAEKFSTDCFDTGYIGHYFCLMVTSGSDGNKTIKNLDDLEAGDTITILDRGASIFEADYRQASYTVGADVEKTKSFFKSCTGKEVHSVKKEFKALVDSNALNQQAYMTSSELGGFDPTKRYGGKNMKKGICSMNQKLFIREALILKYGLKKGLGKYKEFSTILRMRAFEKFYLQSDASLFLADEIAMVKKIIRRIKKDYITKESIESCESISPIMKEFWSKLIDSNYDEREALLMIREIKKNRAFSEESPPEALKKMKEIKYTYDKLTREELNNKDYVMALLLCENFKEDRDFILNAVKQTPLAFVYASPKLKEDRVFILDAVKQTPSAFQYASLSLRNNREFALEAVKNNPSVLQYALPIFGSDEDLMSAAEGRHETLSAAAHGSITKLEEGAALKESGSGADKLAAIDEKKEPFEGGDEKRGGLGGRDIS